MGADTQERIGYTYIKCREAGMTESQAILVLGLVDHESAGTWNENISNCLNPAKECSTGIAQWNQNAGRYAPDTFEKQVELIVREMKEKFDIHDDLIAITKHNQPSAYYQTQYTNKVILSSKQFK